MNTKHLCAAVIIVGAALLKFGAPLVPVLVGILLAVTYALVKLRRAS